MYKIDKSAFTAEELATWNQLVAKAKVDPEAAAEKMEEEVPPMPGKKPEIEMEDEMDKGCKGNMDKKCKKSASPELTAAMERLEALEKSIEMKEFTDIAKKYAELGYKEEELANTLYDMKKSNPANYDAFTSVLEKSLKLQQESGIFTEIGKSGAQGGAPKGAQAKAEAKAREIMKSDSSIGYTEAIAKAWDDPALMAEYDAEYMA